jgi:hypothetical protein
MIELHTTHHQPFRPLTGSPPLARALATCRCSIDEELRRELGGVDAKLKRPWTQVKYLTQEQKYLVRLLCVQYSGMQAWLLCPPWQRCGHVRCALNLTCVVLQSCTLLHTVVVRP